jgi:four helix bundle protein
MSGIQTFRDIQAWQKAHEFVLLIYRLTQKFPSHELYGLISQLRRAALSIAANIVEGYNRTTVQEGFRFYNIAEASLEEVKYELLVARDLGYCTQEEYNGAMQMAEEVGKLLHGWIMSQRHNASPQT